MLEANRMVEESAVTALTTDAIDVVVSAALGSGYSFQVPFQLLLFEVFKPDFLESVISSRH